MIVSKRTGSIGRQVLIAKLTFIIAMTAIGCCYTSAHAQTVFNWGPIPINNDYQNPVNWFPPGIPNATSHAAVIRGNNHDPILNADATLGGLTIRDNGNLDTKTFELVLNPGPPGYVGKTNIFDTGDLWARTGGRFDTEELNILGGGQVHNRGGFIQIDKRGEVHAGGELEGYGTVQVAGSQPLVNNGQIRSNGLNLGLTINRISSGSFDWDGTNEQGKLTVEPNTTLRVNMPVTDGFSHFLTIQEDGVFRVDPAWTLDTGKIDLVGGRIEGGDFIVTDSEAQIICNSSSRIDSNMTMNDGSLVVNLSGFLQFTGNATLGPGAYVLITPGSYIVVDAMFDNDGAEINGNEINVRNGGTFNMTDGLLSLQRLDIDAGGSFAMSEGVLDLDTLNIDSNGSFAMSGGELTAGTVTGSLTLAAGSIEVGETIGVMQVEGDFSLQQDATLAIDLFNAVGSASDVISVLGDVDLAGTLDLRLPSPFTPADGQGFTFLEINNGTLSGEFADLTDGDTVASQDGFDLVIHYQSNSITLVAEQAAVLGDVNLDGVVNLLDVGPFIDLLTSGDYQEEADVNQDGAVNLLDVDDFIDLLAGDQ